MQVKKTRCESCLYPASGDNCANQGQPYLPPVCMASKYDISIFSDIRVKKLDWFVSNVSNSMKTDDVVWGKAKVKRQRKSAKQDRNAPKPKKGYFEIVNVEGEFLNFDGNFRYALSAVDDLEKTMSESGKYYSVEITRRPLDIEPNNRLSGDAGAQRSDSQVRAEVSFRVVREVPEDG